MGVYIKGMEMPKACVYRENGQLITCPLYDIDGYCGALNTEASHKENGKLSDCPLIPVPPHGRLIDADVLMHEFEKAQRTMEQHGREYSCSFMSDSRELSTEWYCVEDMLENAPTILEAEEGET